MAPAVWLAGLAYDGELGVRAVTEAIRISGDWALRLFWLALLVGPARRILSAPRLIRMRRILGLGAFGLTVLHFGLYALDQQFAWGHIGLEIVLRIYLTIGAIAHDRARGAGGDIERPRGRPARRRALEPAARAGSTASRRCRPCIFCCGRGPIRSSRC